MNKTWKEREYKREKNVTAKSQLTNKRKRNVKKTHKKGDGPQTKHKNNVKKRTRKVTAHKQNVPGKAQQATAQNKRKNSSLKLTTVASNRYNYPANRGSYNARPNETAWRNSENAGKFDSRSNDVVLSSNIRSIIAATGRRV